MRLQVKGRGIEVSESVKTYAEGKFRKLERQLDDPEIELELHVEANPKIAEDHTAEAAIRSRRLSLRAHASARGFPGAIDQLVDKLEPQAAKHPQPPHPNPSPQTPPNPTQP